MYLGAQAIRVVARRFRAACRVFGGHVACARVRGVFDCQAVLRLADGLDQTTFDRTRLAQIGRWDEGQRRILCRLGLISLASRSTPCPVPAPRSEADCDFFQLCGNDTAHCRECKHLV